jgi:serine O-acetyltransferase
MTTAVAPSVSPGRVSRTEVRERLRRDRDRLRALYAEHGLQPPKILVLHPSYMCVWLHRWSAYHFQHGRRLRARALWHLNLLITGADLSVISDIGPGLVIVHPISTQVFGRIGANCTIWGYGGIGGGVSVEDIGAGPGLPIVGDGVTFGARSMALGPVRIGDHCVLEPGAIATRDVPAGSTVTTTQPRSFRRVDAD